MMEVLDSSSWRGMTPAELVQRNEYLEHNQFRPKVGGGETTSERMGRMLRGRLEQYEEQQRENSRVAAERKRLRKLSSDRVRGDVETEKRRREETLRGSKPLGQTKLLPNEQLDKIFSTLSRPDPKYSQPDRPKYGVTRADGLQYRYLDDNALTNITCSKLRPDSSPGRDSFRLGKEERKIMLGDNVSFLEHKTGDREMFRMIKRDSFGAVPPPGHYYCGHGEDNFRASATYLQRPLPGRRGLPRIGNESRVIIGHSHKASWVNLQETDFKPAPGHYWRDEVQKATHSYALRAAQPDPSKLLEPMNAGFTIPAQARQLLVPEEQLQAEREQRKEDLDAWCKHGHPRPPSPAATDRPYQEQLSARLLLRAEERWVPTTTRPVSVPSSPLPETSFHRSGKLSSK